MIEFTDKYGTNIRTNQENVLIRDYKTEALIVIIGRDDIYKVSKETLKDIYMQIDKEGEREAKTLQDIMPTIITTVLKETKKGQVIDKKIQYTERRDYLEYLLSKAPLSEQDEKERLFLGWWIKNERWVKYE